jgi:hypothetical protein
MEIRVLLCSAGKMWARRASIGRWGMSSRAVWVACMISPFGSLTSIPFVMGSLFTQWLVIFKKVACASGVGVGCTVWIAGLLIIFSEEINFALIEFDFIASL